jgi:hypothetical protein
MDISIQVVFLGAEIKLNYKQASVWSAGDF